MTVWKTTIIPTGFARLCPTFTVYYFQFNAGFLEQEIQLKPGNSHSTPQEHYLIPAEMIVAVFDIEAFVRKSSPQSWLTKWAVWEWNSDNGIRLSVDGKITDTDTLYMSLLTEKIGMVMNIWQTIVTYNYTHSCQVIKHRIYTVALYVTLNI